MSVRWHAFITDVRAKPDVCFALTPRCFLNLACYQAFWHEVYCIKTFSHIFKKYSSVQISYLSVQFCQISENTMTRCNFS